MKKPVLLINLKTYEQGTQGNALKLANVINNIENGHVEIMVAAQPTDIVRISDSVKTVAQHIDPIVYGSNTGFILPEAVKEAGAIGTLINHSEHRLEFDVIEKTIKRAKELGFKTICCAPTPEMSAKIAKLKPDYIAIEPPELIGTKYSVTKHKPEIIINTVKMVREIDPEISVLCGAGIQNKEDITKALELGSDGILVASSVVKSENPEAAIKDLLSGFLIESVVVAR